MVEKIFLTAKEYQPHLQWWKSYLHAEPFSFRQKPGKASAETVASHSVLLPAQESEMLLRLTGTDDSGVLVCFLVSLGLVLRKYSREQTIVVNVPMLGTEKEGVQDIPLIMKPEAEETLKGLLNRTTATLRNCYSYQDILIGESTGIDTSSLSNILVRHEGLHLLQPAGRYDLTLTISRNGHRPGVRLDFDSNAFDPAFVHNIARHLIRVTGHLDKLDIRPLSIEILGQQERDLLIRGFNNTKREYTKTETVISVFERYAREYPGNVALTYQGANHTYDELNRAANRLAGHLRNRFRIGDRDVVGVMAAGSERLIIALLGIMKAGATYLPVDPDLPALRKQQMLSSARVRLLISDSTDYLLQQEIYSGEIFLMDLELEGIPPDTGGPADVCRPHHLAYIIFTSGTTGAPKGVMVGHEGFANMVRDQVRQFGIRHSDKVLQFASISFDASMSEIFMALCSGAGVVVIDRHLVKDPVPLLDFMRKNDITVLTLPPSYLSVIDWKELCFLRVIISAGEKLNVKPALALSNHLDIFNAYGPTESSVCATINKLAPDMTEEEAESIGGPIANLEIYILDEDGRPVPVGIGGELHIGGTGVAKGYLFQPDLTATKFISDPYSKHPGARLYCTGDLGRWTPDGKIVFIGRRDEQIKLRGYRLEPGEIEQVLREYAPVRQAVVLARGDEQERRLVAFVVAEPSFSRNEAIAFLAARLPDYMIPSLWIELTDLPLNSSGKIDRNALLEISVAGAAVDENSAPRNNTERRLADIWKQIFNLEEVSIYEDFFAMGGDSLLAIRALSHIREEFGLNVPMNVLFKSTTISDLAEYLSAMAAISDPDDDKQSEILLL
jgi:amino acid adenylation domain-containing protein